MWKDMYERDPAAMIMLAFLFSLGTACWVLIGFDVALGHMTLRDVWVMFLDELANG